MLVPQSALHQLNEAGFNQRWLDELLRQTGHAERAGRYKWKFAAGTMFAFQFKALHALLNEDAISLACFEAEAGQLDGTYAHAMERMLGLFATAQGGKIASC
jgi:lipopolysaccharide biosynthesis protein